MNTTDLDVLILGAGLSGVGMAAQLAEHRPAERYALLERREAIGGTWDFFRYPGIRCDSDMFTLGYGFRPWEKNDVITDAATIRGYIQDTAEEYGVLDHVRFGHRVLESRWSSDDATWHVTAEVERTGERRVFRARFLVDCTGYYSYDRAHRPEFPEEARFEGDIVHAQDWDPTYDYDGKDVVVVGSGATAVTVVPAMAERARHVTMLQRSPTYMLTLPGEDVTARALRRVLPSDLVARITRNRNTLIQFSLYHLALRYPKPARRILLEGVRRQLGPDGDMRHFTPDYNPWEQRLCAVPEGDFFRAVRDGRASVVTDEISEFTRDGITLRSGEHLRADVVVLATGLHIQMGGGAKIVVDGEEVDRSDRLMYASAMFDGIPNYVMMVGYANVSWTRKADLVYRFVCRLLARMKRGGYAVVTPSGGEGYEADEPIIRMKSGYIQRSAAMMPPQGTRSPWRVTQNVLLDTILLRLLARPNRFLRFSKRAPIRARREPRERRADLTTPRARG